VVTAARRETFAEGREGGCQRGDRRPGPKGGLQGGHLAERCDSQHFSCSWLGRTPLCPLLSLEMCGTGSIRKGLFLLRP
jgi:hypothetical protein